MLFDRDGMLMGDPVSFDEEARPYWSGAEDKVLTILGYAAAPVWFSGLDDMLRRRRSLDPSPAHDALWRLVGSGRVRVTERWQLEAGEVGGELDEADELRRRLLLTTARLVCLERTGRSWEEAILYMPNIEPSVKQGHWCLEEAIKRLEFDEPNAETR